MPDLDHETALTNLLALVREPDEKRRTYKKWVCPGRATYTICHVGQPYSDTWIAGEDDYSKRPEWRVGYEAILAAFSEPAFRAEHGLERSPEVTDLQLNMLPENRLTETFESVKKQIFETFADPMSPSINETSFSQEVKDAVAAVFPTVEPSVRVQDLVVALRDLGWPEPDTLTNDEAEWGDDPEANGLALDLDERGLSVRYDFSGERGDLTFVETVPFSRLVAAVDRLRWVLGLPERKPPIVAVLERPSEATSVRSPLAGAVARLGRPWEPVV